MSEIKKIIDDLGIAAFESSIQIAAFGVISDSENLVYQTDNWDLSNDIQTIINVIKGQQSFVLNQVEYVVSEYSTSGIIGTNAGGMGHVLLVTFQGGILASYAMPQADPVKSLSFLVSNATKLNGKI